MFVFLKKKKKEKNFFLLASTLLDQMCYIYVAALYFTSFLTVF